MIRYMFPLSGLNINNRMLPVGMHDRFVVEFQERVEAEVIEVGVQRVQMLADVETNRSLVGDLAERLPGTI